MAIYHRCYWLNVKNCEGSKMWPLFQAYKYHDTVLWKLAEGTRLLGQRQRTSLLVAQQVAWASCLSQWFRLPFKSQGLLPMHRVSWPNCWGTLHWGDPNAWSWLQTETLSWLYWTVSKSALCSGGRRLFYIPKMVDMQIFFKRVSRKSPKVI